MISVFRLVHDTSNFDSLKFADGEGLQKRDTNGVQIFSGLETGCYKWRPPLECRWKGSKVNKPTFPYIADGALAMSRLTYDSCYEVFSQCGEYFDVLLDGEEWIVMNIIAICNGLDKRQSLLGELDELGHSTVSKYVVRGRRVSENVFKLPETAHKEMFTSTMTAEPADTELIQMYDQLSLTGLVFEEIETI
jgi:hypothetical protein